MLLIVLLLYILVGLVILATATSLVIFSINTFFVDAPFVPVRQRVLVNIIKALKLKPGSVIYDLGCGDARVLVEAIKSTDSIKAIGIEKHLMVYLWTKWKTRHTKIKLHFGDIYNLPISDATHIYLYLYPEILDNLLPKIKKECKPGTHIVSCDFTFKDLTPDEIIDLPIMEDRLCKKLNVYVLK